MSRGTTKSKKRNIKPDEKFSNILISRLINYVMENGKKSVAEKIVYTAFEKAEKELKSSANDIFEQAIKNAGPIVEVRGKRIGGANYQVPVEVNRDRKTILAMRWIISSAKNKKGKAMADKLAEELISAYRGEGAAIKKKEETHKMAEANKAFAHFARF
jgi:small subunit ribosomal protein S7